jgi:nitroreductase
MSALPVASMTVMEAIRNRRSIRSYKPERVDPAVVRALLQAAVQAPTAIHAEPWAFVVIQDPARLRRYSDLAKASLSHEMSSLHAGRPTSEATEFTRHLLDPNFNIFYDASTLIVICGKGSGPYVVADCWLAAENLMLAATALGLGTCCIGSAVPTLNSAPVRSELGIPGGVTTIAPILVGLPREAAEPVPRKEPEILCWS